MSSGSGGMVSHQNLVATYWAQLSHASAAATCAIAATLLFLLS